MFDVAVWGTVAAWASAVGTPLTIAAGLFYYVFDKRIEAAAQAKQIYLSIGSAIPPQGRVYMENTSEKSIFDIRIIVTHDSAMREELGKAEREAVSKGKAATPRPQPTFVNAGGQAVNTVKLEPGQSLTIDFMTYPDDTGHWLVFRDARGKTWMTNAFPESALWTEGDTPEVDPLNKDLIEIAPGRSRTTWGGHEIAR